jgi:UDP-GlcNAc:undecaprenyl-phosphate/decaprenyl-phosphate GlcNAc-1-phosphate transferase
MTKYLILFFIACAVSVGITPLVKWIALKFGAIDLPGERKIHTKPMPRLGGLAIYSSFFLVVFVALFFYPSLFPPDFQNYVRLGWIFLATTIVVGIGVIDDFRSLPPGIKFFFQIAAAVIIAVTCFRIESLFGFFELGVLAIPFTVLWIVAITNAVNLIDGLDGLAAGTALVVCITLACISLVSHSLGTALVLAILAGAILGFLKYNFHPASIFLGDSGAYFLGFILSILSLMSNQRQAATIGILAPLIALGLPIMDTCLAMLRRLLQSLHIIEIDQDNNIVKILFTDRWSMFTADRAHIHHKLLQMGLNQKRAVTVLYAISAIFGMIALTVVYIGDKNYALFITLLGGIIYIAVKRLGYQEIRILSNGTLLPLIYSRTLNKKIMRIFMDAGLIALSYYLALILRFEQSLTGNLSLHYWSALPLILVVKLAIFYTCSLYQGIWLYTGVNELIKILRAVILGGVVSAFLMRIIPFCGIVSYTVLIIDFNLLILFVVGARMSFRILDYMHVVNKEAGKKVLIYGAGKRGTFALREILSNPRLGMNPVGFIDDSIRFEKKQILGLPVFGNLNVLEPVIQERQVAEVIICREGLEKDKIEQLKEICNRCGILLSQYQTTFESVDDVIPDPAGNSDGPVLME